VTLKKKQPAAVAASTKKKEPDEASGVALLGEVVATKKNQTKRRKKPTAKAGAKKQKTNAIHQTKDQEVETRFVCQIHCREKIELEELTNLKAYLKPSATYKLTELLTNSHCHNCSNFVGEHDSIVYCCLNEDILHIAVEDESQGGRSTWRGEEVDPKEEPPYPPT
jgi:hypothetical protein